MTVYAQIENSIVTSVIVADGDLELDSSWVVASLDNTNVRAVVGAIYDATEYTFKTEKPYPSFQYDTNTCQWSPPKAMPLDGNFYVWDEETISWIQVGN